MTTKYYKVTEKELLALIATAETCLAMVNDDDDFAEESKRSQKAIKAICKRNGRRLITNYSYPTKI